MTTVFLGIIAALAWGFHDICVRLVSAKSEIIPAFFAALVTGTIFFIPVAVIFGDWGALNSPQAILGSASGFAFGLAGLAHFKAFSIGPVRLVAPIIGAYPVLSIVWAAASGSPVQISHWIAVLAVVGGVAIVAALSDPQGVIGRCSPAIFWSVAAGMGWAISFALGQRATVNGLEIPVILITHLAAVSTVLVIAVLTGNNIRPDRALLPVLTAMGALNTLALGVVLSAGALPNPEFASVVASTFGLVTVLLAWLFLRERISLPQWSGVLTVFAAIAYLGL